MTTHNFLADADMDDAMLTDAASGLHQVFDPDSHVDNDDEVTVEDEITHIRAHLTSEDDEERKPAIRESTLPKSMQHGVVGMSESLVEVYRMVDRVADTTCTILITGESGTGKENIARAVHRTSERAEAPFVAVNCGAIPEALLESELFGHARGAFTGAHQAKPGRIAMAQGGTLFLDEIGELPLALQVKLLRVL